MSQQSIHEPVPWTIEEDAILTECWLDPDVDYFAISKLLGGNRTAGAIQHRGSKIGLGQKARHKKVKKSANGMKAWPKDMPNFEDHPQAGAPGSRAKAARLGSRVKAFSQDAEFSRAGSSLAGAAINPNGRRV